MFSCFSRIPEITIGGVTKRYGYVYDDMPEHNLTDMILRNGVKQSLGCDAFGRMHAITQTVNGKVITDENRYYLKYGDRTTDYISSVRFGVNDSFDEQTKYKYDKAGNISEIYENGILTVRYIYDKLNRIVREDNKALKKTVVNIYDIGGNILTKNVYAFTLGCVTEKTPALNTITIAVCAGLDKADVWRFKALRGYSVAATVSSPFP